MIVHIQLIEESEDIHLSKGNRIINAKNSKMARGLGKACYECGKEISTIPYFSHLSGGSHRIHYYHLECAKKINFV